MIYLLLNNILLIIFYCKLIAQEYLTGERLSGSADVQVTVIAVPCRGIYFTNTTYIAYIPENPTRGTYVTTLAVCILLLWFGCMYYVFCMYFICYNAGCMYFCLSACIYVFIVCIVARLYVFCILYIFLLACICCMYFACMYNKRNTMQSLINEYSKLALIYILN